MTALNLWCWPRADGLADPAQLGPVSVLIPARNEAQNIGACVAACTRLGANEVLVYDDGSTDETLEVLRRLRDAGAPGLRVIEGVPLPQGWAGKSHACMQLARSAKNDALLFVDADVHVAADALMRVAHLEQRFGHAVMTAVPLQRMGSFFEALVMPLLYTTYTSWLYLPLVHGHRDPRFLAANGQFLFVRRALYNRVGGFAAVGAAVVDDMAFCRAAKHAGVPVLFADGSRLATCRMYRGGSALVQGFGRSLSAGFGGSVPALAACTLLYAWAFVVPALVAAWASRTSLLHAPAVVASLATWLGRAALAVRFRHPIWSVLLAPFGALGLIGIAARAMRQARAGAVHWKGRRYPAVGPAADRA